jgi:two-component system alkaline phosphatase synthesis response regulator PhoP
MSKTVFVIEDDFFLQGLEVARLKKEGFNVEAAADVEEVKKIIEKKSKVDLILLDLMLPGVDGFEVLKIMRKEETLATVPVIVFTNLSEEKDVEKAKKMGISEYIVKSNLELDDLIKKVKELI